jgi:hypothetical protein
MMAADSKSSVPVLGSTKYGTWKVPPVRAASCCLPENSPQNCKGRIESQKNRNHQCQRDNRTAGDATFAIGTDLENAMTALLVYLFADPGAQLTST